MSSCHDTRPTRGVPSNAVPVGPPFGAKIAITAPCGSCNTAYRPVSGMSIAGMMTFAPSDSACRAVLSTLFTSTEGIHIGGRSEEHTSELQSQSNLVCRLLLEKKKKNKRKQKSNIAK